MNSKKALKDAWNAEYTKKGIPSSFRKDPTRVVTEFIAWLVDKNYPLEGLAADIGCGQGRNSFYLASQGFHVTGIEWLEENVNSVHKQAQDCHLPVQAFAQDAASDWPIKPHSLTLAIDVFCYKHIINKEEQAKYRQHLYQALKPGGLYFISLASEQDGFYGPLLKNSPDPQKKLIIDPYSNIPSLLYSKDALIKEFSDFFELIQIDEQYSMSPMYGKDYPRVVLNAVFKKR